MTEMLSYQFVQNAVLAGLLASLLCGLVGTFVVVKRLVFVSGGISHAAFGGLGIFYYLGLSPLLGAAATAVLAAFLLGGRGSAANRSNDALIGILWAVGMAVGVVFMARTPGFAPNLASYLFGDILAVSRPLIAALAIFAAAVLICVGIFFKEMLAVSFDEEYARSQGVSTRTFLLTLMVLIALSVVLLIQVVGAILAIALLTIPPVISLSISKSFRSAIVLAVVVGMVMTMSGLVISFRYDLPSGPTIVLFGFLLLMVAKLVERLRTGSRRSAAGLIAILLLSMPLLAAAADSETETETGFLTPIRHLEFLGEAHVSAAASDSLPLGGLSGLTYDAGAEAYYAVSDDRAERGPARFYTLKIDLSAGRLERDGVQVVGATRLTGSGGKNFAAGRIDPEAVALTASGTLIVASEGDARIELEPFLREFSLDGSQRRDFPLGERYAPRSDQPIGVRYNLALESAALAPGGRFLFSATENALVQDGPTSTLESGSPGRILRYDLAQGRIESEYLYWIDPVAEAPEPAGEFATSGVVDLIALDDETLLVLERSFSVGRGNDVRLYEADLSAASDIRSTEALDQQGMADVRPVTKRLLLHIDQIGVEPDNLEGMALGPTLPDGRATLLLISDDNFNPRDQVTQVLAFALDTTTPTIASIQGAAHRSPFEGDWVRGVVGIVTAVDDRSRSGGFWMQATDDGDSAISDALYVTSLSGGVRPGDSVRIDGGVREVGTPSGLTVTTLDAARVEIAASGQPLPSPVRLDRSGRMPPPVVIDDDGLAHYDPCCDAIDFFESLEAMRVEVPNAVVVAGTSRFSEIVVIPDGGRDAGLRSSRGGVVLRPGDPNPQRLILDDRLAPPAPDVGVGQTFDAPATGVLDYGFGNYRIQVDGWPSVGDHPAATPATARAASELSIATYNVLNLDPTDPPEKFEALAGTIVAALASPALLGLQEVQDDNGAADDGVVSAARTLELLLEAVRAAGGPAYEYRQIDPEPNADGGEPNGNIRVVWLFDPARVEMADGSGASAALGLEGPVRIAADSPAFAGDPDRGWEGGRKCLAVDALAGGERLTLVNCHLKSKRGDDRLFGPTQPPVFRSEEQRSAQVRQILDYLGTRLATDPAAQIVVLGDMNEHEFRPPMRLLTSAGLVNLVERIPEAERYSFNFNGNSQLLDHILVSPSLAGRVTAVTVVHVNADQPEARRASDHDPVLVRLRPSATH